MEAVHFYESNTFFISSWGFKTVKMMKKKENTNHHLLGLGR